jgi:hypothetical protein
MQRGRLIVRIVGLNFEVMKGDGVIWIEDDLDVAMAENSKGLFGIH